MKKHKSRVITSVLVFWITASTVLADGKVVVKPSEGNSSSYTIVGEEAAIPELLSESAIVVDMNTGYTLVEKNIYEKHYPASITKIMTAMLTIENTKLEDIVTFSHDAVFTVEAGSSAAYVDEGEQLTVEQCLYGLMLISGNDLANGLAEQVAGSMSQFATMMTAKAEEIGCLNTNFVNAHGLHDENHYTTAHDMAVIGKYAYENYELFRTLCSTGYYECQPTNKQPEVRCWRNNNRLINKYQEQFYEECIGGKTGYTNQAGGTLVSYAEINGRVIMCVVMKSANSLSAYADTTNLYEYVKNNVTASTFATLDDRYAKEQEANSQQGTDVTEETESAGKTSISTSASDKKGEEDDSLWIGWKILIFIVTVFIIYYAYVQYVRYQRRKRRRERRRRRRMEQQRMNSQSRNRGI